MKIQQGNFLNSITVETTCCGYKNIQKIFPHCMLSSQWWLYVKFTMIVRNGKHNFSSSGYSKILTYSPRLEHDCDKKLNVENIHKESIKSKKYLKLLSFYSSDENINILFWECVDSQGFIP